MRLKRLGAVFELNPNALLLAAYASVRKTVGERCLYLVYADPVLGGDLGEEEYDAEFIARRIVHYRSIEPRPASFHGHPAHHVVILGILWKPAI